MKTIVLSFFFYLIIDVTDFEAFFIERCVLISKSNMWYPIVQMNFYTENISTKKNWQWRVICPFNN